MGEAGRFRRRPGYAARSSASADTCPKTPRVRGAAGCLCPHVSEDVPCLAKGLGGRVLMVGCQRTNVSGAGDILRAHCDPGSLRSGLLRSGKAVRVLDSHPGHQPAVGHHRGAVLVPVGVVPTADGAIDLDQLFDGVVTRGNRNR